MKKISILIFKASFHEHCMLSIARSNHKTSKWREFKTLRLHVNWIWPTERKCCLRIARWPFYAFCQINSSETSLIKGAFGPWAKPTGVLEFFTWSGLVDPNKADRFFTLLISYSYAKEAKLIKTKGICTVMHLSQVSTILSGTIEIDCRIILINKIDWQKKGP